MISISLAKDQLAVEPGSAVTLTCTTTNHAQTAGRFEIEIEGLDHEWIALPAPAFTLGADETRAHKILIKPPRSAESKAGSYPFVVRVRSLDTGEGAEAQAVLEVEGFSLISLEIAPKRGAAKYLSKEEDFAVTVINLGNTDQTLQFFADDPEDGCTYQFAADRVQIAPGQQKQVALKVQPTHFPLIGAPRLFGFGVSARGVQNPHLNANVQAQIERRSLITPTVLLVTLLIFALAIGWWAIRPQPPKMDSFSTDSAIVYVGDTIRLKWTAEGADTGVLIESDKGDSFPNNEKNGWMDVQIKGPVVFYAYAVNKAGFRSEPLKITITPQLPEAVPLPKIEKFSIDKRTAKVGDTITIQYSVSNATKIILQPTNDVLPLNMTSYQTALNKAGTINFSLIAYNKIDQADQSKQITVVVTEPSDASIISFQAMQAGAPLEDKEIEPGTTVSLEWQISGASRAEISGIGQLPDLEKGTIDVTPAQTTVYTLTVKDSKGRPVVGKVTVKVKKTPEGGGNG